MNLFIIQTSKHQQSSLRAKRSNPVDVKKTGLLRRNIIPPRNDGFDKPYRNIFIVFSLALAFFFSLPASATMHPSERMTNPSLEIRAQALYKDLRCITCDGQSVAESQSDMAFAIRSLVREQLTNGADNNEILSYLQDRYGDQILMQPPFKPATWLLWLLPIIALTGGSLFVFQTFRNKA